ncbi:MAG: CBS domain-containing protein, partial [Dehalococcoidia bacterium]|nr:CBS domain-containing protein [Dehalococcoidia bacterium]
MICPTCRANNIEGVDLCVNCDEDLRGYDQPDMSGWAERGPEFIYEALRVLAPKKPSFINPREPVGLAVRLMQSEDTDCVLAMDGDRLVGIITPADILHKVAGPNEDLN